MLSKEDFVEIQALARRGVYLCDIAERIGVHPKTVSRSLQRGAAPQGRARPERGSKLVPYCDVIDELLRDGVWNAVVILREIQSRGYAGSMTILKDYIRPKRTLREKRATVRFETRPGKQLQNDWGEVQTIVAGQETEAHFSVNTLGFSRRFHFWCTDCEDKEHTYEGLIRSFEHFGGVTEEVLVDNQKTAVLEHRAGEAPRFNEGFLDLSGRYGFTPRACKPNRAQTKGKDERNVGYIKHHFFVRYRSFESFAHMNQLAEQWLKEEADPRFHGTVKEVVAERFSREAPHLKPLPRERYDTSYRETRCVAWDAYIDVRGNRYAVPDSLVGQKVAVRISLDDEIRVYAGEQLVAKHRIRPVSSGWAKVPEFHETLWRETLRVEQRDLSVYEEVGSWS